MGRERRLVIGGHFFAELFVSSVVKIPERVVSLNLNGFFQMLGMEPTAVWPVGLICY
jgi:hypothetical protein